MLPGDRVDCGHVEPWRAQPKRGANPQHLSAAATDWGQDLATLSALLETRAALKCESYGFEVPVDEAD